jgi:hypothetical protein
MTAEPTHFLRSYATHLYVVPSKTHCSVPKQAAPHPPQFWLVFRGTHLAPQQPSPAAHSLPQRPQLNRSKTTFVHTRPQQRSSGEEQQPSPHFFSPFGQGRPRPSGGAAQATPETEAKTVPTMALPINRNTLRREMVPLASPLASSSKEFSLGLQPVHSAWVEPSPFRSSAAIRLLPSSRSLSQNKTGHFM